jgi:hypothetical protein
MARNEMKTLCSVFLGTIIIFSLIAPVGAQEIYTSENVSGGRVVETDASVSDLNGTGMNETNPHQHLFLVDVNSTGSSGKAAVRNPPAVFIKDPVTGQEYVAGQVIVR